MADSIEKIFLHFSHHPVYLVDIGALGGLKEPWRQVSKYIKIIGFEPQAVGGGESSSSFDSIALYDIAGHHYFYYTNVPDFSSLLQPNIDVLQRYGELERYKLVKREKVITDTLDSQLSKKNINFLDFIKLDTQGTEGRILKGAANTLNSSVFGLEVEANFVERYKNQDSFCDVHKFITSFGFEIFDLQRRFCKRQAGIYFGNEKGQLTHGNALYFRTNESIHYLLSKQNNNNLKSIIVSHFILIILLYGYFDYALEIVKSYKNSFMDVDYRLLINFIEHHKISNARIKPLRGRYRFSKILLSLVDYIKPVSKRGRIGDDRLGNY